MELAGDKSWSSTEEGELFGLNTVLFLFLSVAVPGERDEFVISPPPAQRWGPGETGVDDEGFACRVVVIAASVLLVFSQGFGVAVAALEHVESQEVPVG